jgi:hypothetical protein
VTRSRGVVVALGALLALAVALPPRSPVASALTGESLPGVTLVLSPAYLALAPVFGVWDALTVLSITQHLGVLGGMVLVFLVWRFLRRRAGRFRGLFARTFAEAALVVAFIAAVLGFYAVGALVSRPMARLVVADPDVVVVDFHSHTLSSHDGREGFNEEHNRAWHEAAGFHVAYITDHDSVRLALKAAAANPSRAGEGTIVLPGREVMLRRQHVAVLGTRDPRVIMASTNDGTTLVGPDGRCPEWPVLVHTIPEDLSLVPLPECADGAGGVHAIELLDGAPRGLGQSDRERDRIVRIADSLDIALVSSSNLHGWGRTASGWSLLRIPGWREMTPEEVGSRIEETIRAEGWLCWIAAGVVGVRRLRARAGEAPAGAA